jgi:hypothetical protein
MADNDGVPLGVLFLEIAQRTWSSRLPVTQQKPLSTVKQGQLPTAWRIYSIDELAFGEYL